MAIKGLIKYEKKQRERKLLTTVEGVVDLDEPNAHLELQKLPEGSAIQTSWLTKYGKVMFGKYYKPFEKPFVEA